MRGTRLSLLVASLLGASALSGCTVYPLPLTDTELSAAADLNAGQVVTGQEPISGPVTLYEAMARALSVIEAKRNEFDVVAVYLPNRWERGFFGPEGDDFDLHDYIKAIAAVRAIPTQVINDDSALSYRCRCTREQRDAGRAEADAWWLAPVGVAEPARDELVIKLALALGSSGVDPYAVIHAQRTATMRHLQDLTRLKLTLTTVPGGHPNTLGTDPELLVLEHRLFTVEAQLRWLDYVEATLATRPAHTVPTGGTP